MKYGKILINNIDLLRMHFWLCCAKSNLFWARQFSQNLPGTFEEQFNSAHPLHRQSEVGKKGEPAAHVRALHPAQNLCKLGVVLAAPNKINFYGTLHTKAYMSLCKVGATIRWL